VVLKPQLLRYLPMSRITADTDEVLELSYLLRSAKLCAVHNAQSGPPSGAKFLCAVVALPAAQPDHLCVILYHNILGSAATPALSSSVAVTVRLSLPGAARRLWSAVRGRHCSLVVAPTIV